MAVPAVISSVQRRRLSAGGKSGGDGKEEGLFDRLKKTFQEEIDKVCAICLSHCHTVSSAAQTRPMCNRVVSSIAIQRTNTLVDLANDIIGRLLSVRLKTGYRGYRIVLVDGHTQTRTRVYA